ncbi:hypothetical protein V5O48_012816 [Marasmius crinis-equi]|uniref:HAT C-terminal dimerisation domain-containing protein n=1 Tax=Marasmius crinis-equi TaxID=585013 RepID=A0ABR3F1T6_9AGAR
MTSTAVETDDTFDERDCFAAKKRRRAVASTGDALEDWLNSPPIDTDAPEDPICWWVEDYPKTREFCKQLQRMGLDIMAMPATSADVERGFSRGWLMVTARRYRLVDETIRKSILLSYWGHVPGLLPEDLISKALGDKNKRVATRTTVAKVIEAATDIEDDDDIEMFDPTVTSAFTTPSASLSSV